MRLRAVTNIAGSCIFFPWDKFVAPGTTPFVRIWAEEAGEQVRLWFEDNGIGIAPEYHEKIFEMFQQLNAGWGGTGAGLPLARKVMEKMCGGIGVESKPGRGSRFWLRFKSAENYPPDFQVPAREACG